MVLQQHSRSQRRRRLNLAGALAIGVLVAAPSTALASTVVSDGAGGLSFRTPVGEKNDLTITQDATTLFFRDAGSNIQADPTSGCVKVDRGVDCPTPAPADASALPLTILLGDNDDRLDNQTSVRTTVNGGAGDDLVLGGSARDVITGAAGRDNIEGRDGDDFIDTGGTFPDTVACGAGVDRILVDRADTVVSPEDCESIQFVASPGDGTGDTPPADTPDGTPPTGTPQADVVTPPSADSGQVVPVFIPGACANNITGTNRSNTLTGTSGGDNILALAGNDRVNAVAGNDCVFGGTGRDILSGGSGRDFLSGESGTDRLSGSSGDDRLSGGSGSDRLSGGSDKDRVAGDAGHDVITGGGGRDHLYGGDGNDRMSGGADIDRLYGGDGNDRLSGGTAVNVLDGGRGRDTIYARNGVRDRINCGSGRDVVHVDRRDRPARNCEVVKR